MAHFIARYCLYLLLLSCGAVVAGAAPTVSILSLPRQVLTPGESTTLSVSAIGTGTLRYAWTHNGRPVSGASGSLLPLPNVTYRDSGYYLAVVTDATGTQRSAALFVTVAPLNTQVGFGSVDDIVAVASSDYHSLYLKRDGTVVATDGWAFPYGQATVPAGLNNVVAVAASTFHSLALKADGTIVTWGGDQWGPYQIPADLGDCVAIFAGGGEDSFAIKRDGTLVKWGRNGYYGYIPPGLTDVVDFTRDGGTFLALQLDGKIVPFGVTNSYGIDTIPPSLTDVVAITMAPAPGHYAVALKAAGTIVTWGDGAATLPDTSYLNNVVAIERYYALRADGTVVYLTTGQSPYPNFNSVFSLPGLLRDATNDTAPAITTQPVGQTVLEDQSTVLTVIATGPERLLYQWRKNGVGVAGATTSTLAFTKTLPADAGDYDVVISNHMGSVTSSIATLMVNPLPAITSQSMGRQMLLPGQALSLSVNATGTGALSYQWTRNTRPVPGATTSSFSLSNVTVRDSAAYVLRITDSNGTRRSPPMFVLVAPAVTEVRAWGNYSAAQMEVPAGLNDVIALAAGESNVLALRRDGTVLAWGAPTPSDLRRTPGWSEVVAVASTDNKTYALLSGGRSKLHGASSDDFGRSKVEYLSDVVALAAASYYSLALLSDGTVVGSGYNFPNYVYPNDQSPVVEAGSGNIAIAAGGAHALALKADGTVVVWGSNTFGQTDLPIGIANVTAIAAGYYHSLALKADGTVVAWGRNDSGQTDVPPGLGNVVGISAGSAHSLAVKADGTVVAWGSDLNGQASPPADLSNVFAVSAGYFSSFALRDVSNEGPPVIFSQPSSAMETLHSPAIFSAMVAGAQPIMYQWRKDGVNILGATGASYRISNVNAGDAGSYSVVATNSEGSATSNAAVLSVLPPPGDFNGDDQPDVLWQNLNSHESTVWLMNGTTVAGYQQVTPPGFYAQIQIVGVADFTGDGRLELLVQHAGRLGLWSMNEEGQWLMAGSSEPAGYQFLTWVGWGWYAAGVADFNGDSHPDIIWENTRTGEHAIWLCNGTALTTWIPLGTVGIQWSVAGAGDFNGDNKPDLVWQNSLTGERKVWLMNDTIKSSEVSLGFVALAWSIGAVADYNSDGSPDIFWQNTLTGEHAIWLMNGTALVDYVSLPVTTLDWVVGRIPLRPATADFGLDGKSDLVWQNIGTGERKVWHMNGAAMASEVSLGTVGLPWQIAGTGDMDGNAECDILWQNTSTGERAIWLMSGTTLSGYVSLGTVPLDWQMTGTGDFNNDNNTDIVWQNTSTGERGIWLMAGTTLSGWASFGNVSPAWQIAGVADFNRDDNPDLLWQNASTGERKVWHMNGTTFGSEASLGVVGVAWKIVGAADYNGDGSVDILWQNTVTGEGGIWLLNGIALSGYVPLPTQPLVWQIAN